MTSIMARPANWLSYEFPARKEDDNAGGSSGKTLVRRLFPVQRTGRQSASRSRRLFTWGNDCSETEEIAGQNVADKGNEYECSPEPWNPCLKTPIKKGILRAIGKLRIPEAIVRF
jgi:hypothetical protein